MEYQAMTKLLFAITVLLSSTLFAQQMSNSTNTFVSNFYKGKSVKHRSGVVKEISKFNTLHNDLTIPDIIESEGDDDETNIWHAKKMKVFNAKYSLKKNRLLKKFIKNNSEYPFNISYDNESHIFTLTAQTPITERAVAFDENDALSKSNDIINNYLPFIKNKIEFETFAFEEMAHMTEENVSGQNENSEVIEYGVRYRRIFKGGIVRKNLSFVELWYTADGTLKKIEFRWPQFKAKKKFKAITINEAWLQAIEKLNDLCDNNMELVANSIFKGVALAWVPLKDGEIKGKRSKVIPSFSFRVEIPAYEENAKEVIFIDIPAIRK